MDKLRIVARKGAYGPESILAMIEREMDQPYFWNRRGAFSYKEAEKYYTNESRLTKSFNAAIFLWKTNNCQ